MSTHNTELAVVMSPQSQQQLTTKVQSFGLYQDVLQKPQIFWEKLRAFHSSFASKFSIPTVGGKSLDLHQLFVEVTSRGGLEKVIGDRRWKEVIAAFNFPSTITSASFVLRKYYLSLLYHFEQAYLFQKDVPSLTTPDNLEGTLAIGSTTLDEGVTTTLGSTTLDEGVTMNHVPGSQQLQLNHVHSAGSQQLQLGSVVSGTIDGKFDNGYLVSVNLGPDQQLNGILYHIPDAFDMSQNTRTTSDIPSRRQRKRRSRLLSRDPSRPKSNRSGYNFFFQEQYPKLKPLHSGEERVITKRISVMWNNLTQAEKQIYAEKGVQDKERYRSEMLQYRCSVGQ